MSWLGAPKAADVVLGKHTLNLYGLQDQSVAAPVSLSQLKGIQEVSLSPNISRENIFQQGGGEDKLKYATEKEWNGTLTMKGGQLSQLATLLGLTMGSSGQYGIPHLSTDEPIGFITRRIYQKDNVTLIGEQVIPDVKFGDIGIEGPMDQADIQVPIFSDYQPFTLIGAQTVYDLFTTNGTTTSFTPSSTPVAIQADLNAPNNELANIYAFWLKHWATGDRVGTRQLSGYTITPATPVITFTTAPAAGKLGYLYAKAI